MTDSRAPDPTAAGDATPSLATLADEAWAAAMEDGPLYATAIGDHGHLSTFRRTTPARPSGPHGGCSFLDRAAAIPPDALFEADRVTLAALVDDLSHRLGLVESGVDRWAVDPLDGPQVTFLNVASYQPLTTEAEGRAAIERWRAMGPWIDRHMEGLRAGAADGLVAPRALVDSVTDELDGILEASADASPLADLVGPERPGWSATALTAFRDGIAAAIRDDILPAFDRYRAFLATELRPIARPDDRPGLGHVPGGEEAYRRLVRAHTSLELEPEAIHAIGLEETSTDRRRVRRARRARAGDARPAATLAGLRGDPALRFTTRDEVRRPPSGHSSGRRLRSRTGSAGCPRPPARSCHARATRSSTRRSPTTASRPRTAPGPASTTSTRTRPRRGRATRPRRSPSTRRSPATISRSRSPRS